MKTILTTILALTLSIGLLAGCDRSKNSSAGVNSNFDFYNNPNQFPANYEFSARARVINDRAFRRLLKGDFCRSVKRDCKSIDGEPRISLALSQLEIPLYQGVAAKFTLSVQPRGRYYAHGPAVGYLFPILHREQAGQEFVGDAIDQDFGNGFGSRVQFVGFGNPASGSFLLKVYFENKLILEAEMIRRR
jgi:hypothetical protein